MLFGGDMCDASVFGQFHIDNLVEDMLDAILRRVISQEIGEQAGVKVIGVRVLDLQIQEHIFLKSALRFKLLFDLAIKDPAIEIPWRTLTLAQRGNREAGAIICLQVALQFKPPFAEIKSVDDFITLKGMIEILPFGVPINKLDGQLICG